MGRIHIPVIFVLISISQVLPQAVHEQGSAVSQVSKPGGVQQQVPRVLVIDDGATGKKTQPSAVKLGVDHKEEIPLKPVLLRQTRPLERQDARVWERRGDARMDDGTRNGPRDHHMMDGPREPRDMMDGPRDHHMMDGPRDMMDGPREPRDMMDGPRDQHMMERPMDETQHMEDSKDNLREPTNMMIVSADGTDSQALKQDGSKAGAGDSTDSIEDVSSMLSSMAVDDDNDDADHDDDHDDNHNDEDDDHDDDHNDEDEDHDDALAESEVWSRDDMVKMMREYGHSWNKDDMDKMMHEYGHSWSKDDMDKMMREYGHSWSKDDMDKMMREYGQSWSRDDMDKMMREYGQSWSRDDMDKMMREYGQSWSRDDMDKMMREYGQSWSRDDMDKMMHSDGHFWSRDDMHDDHHHFWGHHYHHRYHHHSGRRCVFWLSLIVGSTIMLVALAVRRLMKRLKHGASEHGADGKQYFCVPTAENNSCDEAAQAILSKVERAADHVDPELGDGLDTQAALLKAYPESVKK